MLKKIAIIALLVIAIVAVTGAAIYITQQRQESQGLGQSLAPGGRQPLERFLFEVGKEQGVATKTEEPTVQPEKPVVQPEVEMGSKFLNNFLGLIEIQPTDQPQGWNLFQNYRGRFQFKYPASAKLFIEQVDEPKDFEESSWIIATLYFWPTSLSISLQKKTVEECVTHTSPTGVVTPEEIEINGTTFFRSEFWEGRMGGGGAWDIQYTSFYRDACLEFFFSSEGKRDEARELAESIMRTFSTF